MDFTELKNEQMNYLCADCDFINIKYNLDKSESKISNWVSLTYGIFLCSKCS